MDYVSLHNLSNMSKWNSICKPILLSSHFTSLLLRDFLWKNKINLSQNTTCIILVLSAVLVRISKRYFSYSKFIFLTKDNLSSSFNLYNNLRQSYSDLISKQD